jgi:hypothetical protein
MAARVSPQDRLFLILYPAAVEPTGLTARAGVRAAGGRRSCRMGSLQ